MLDLVDLHKTFARGTVNAHVGLDGLSLHLNHGDFVTIIGSNGAGKSTLFSAICRQLLTSMTAAFALDGAGHHLPARAQARPRHRPRVSGPHEGHGAGHDHRGKPGAGLLRAPQRPLRLCAEHEKRYDLFRDASRPVTAWGWRTA